MKVENFENVINIVKSIQNDNERFYVIHFLKREIESKYRHGICNVSNSKKRKIWNEQNQDRFSFGEFSLLTKVLRRNRHRLLCSDERHDFDYMREHMYYEESKQNIIDYLDEFLFKTIEE